MSILRLTDELLALNRLNEDYIITTEDWRTAMSSIKTAVNQCAILLENITSKVIQIKPTQWVEHSSYFSNRRIYSYKESLITLKSPYAVSCEFYDSEFNRLQLKYTLKFSGADRFLEVECNKNIMVYVIIH
jgi:hypothetical protein